MNYTVTLCPSSSTPVAPTAAPKAPTAAPKAPTATPKAPTAAPTAAPKAPTTTTTKAPTAGPKAPSVAPTKAPTTSPVQAVKPTGAANDESVSSVNLCLNSACPTTASCCSTATGPLCYYPTQYSCLTGSSGLVLCAAGDGVCGTACYNTLNYKCCNNALYSINDANAACAASGTRSLLSTETDTDMDLTTEYSSSSTHVYCCWLTLCFLLFSLL